MSNNSIKIGYQTFFENLIHLAFVAEYNTSNQDKQHKNEIILDDLEISVISKRFENLLNSNPKKQFTSFIVKILGNEISKDYFDSLISCFNNNRDFESKFFKIDFDEKSIKSNSNIGITANYSTKKRKEEHHIDIFSKVIFDNERNLIGAQGMFTNADEKYHYFQQMNLSSIKSAIAAIMARNMSHNLGSHVFYYTRNQINGLSENEADYERKSDLKGLSWFLHYVQERQDFVATITGQDDYYMGPLNLKTDVLDEITPDAVDLRHSSAPPATNFILKYIVNSEGLCRQEKTGTKDDASYLDDIEISIINGNNLNDGEFNSWDNSDIAKKFYDFDLAVKGGQQSRHAFLIILENIIRNAAKHGYKKGNVNGLKITIKITEKNKGGDYLIEIFDNCENGNKAVPLIKSFINNLKILGENSNLTINKASKGLKEIIVCIAWLKGETLTSVFNDMKGIRNGILDIKKINKNNKYNLCYSFTLPKFLPIIEINNLVIKKLNTFKKHGQIHICKDERTLSNATKHFPHATLKLNDGNYWEAFANIKSESDQKELPLIIFERDGSIFCKTDKFAFISNTDEILKAADDRKFILFKNHLNKSTESLKEYFELTDKIPINSEISRTISPTFIDNLSGATYAFNLFQKAQFKEKEEEIYYKIIESFYTRILIVDERLCPIDNIESQFAELIINPNLDSIRSFVKKYVSDAVDDHIQKINQILKIQTENDGIREFNDKIAELKEYWERIEFKKRNTDHTVVDFKYTRKFYKRQNTFLFNMSFNGDLLKPRGEANRDLVKINPHFFSIHIGLLDKLNIPELKDKSTSGKLKFLKQKLNIPNSTYIAVHSGRGGLTENQKEVTFIPFANLQWSLENCKFKLSELFYNQIYFPID